MLVRIVKSWTFPDLSRQTQGGNCIWDGVKFTFDPVDECDFLLVLNAPRDDFTVSCPPKNVWALFQEPDVPGYFPWMRERHDQYARVYTSNPPSENRRYVVAPPLVPWHVGKTFDQLMAVQVPEKHDGIVWITSSLQTLPGHRKRYGFYRYLAGLRWPELTVCGRGISPVHDKWDLLAGSRYAVAVENHRGPHYWTEKIADCWLAYSLPFYSGCTNLEEYFPSEAFIRIDMDDYAGAAAIIRRYVDDGEYEKRLPAIREAREILLRKYQFFPFFSVEVLKSIENSFRPELITIKAYRQSLVSRVRETVSRRLS